MYIILKYIDEYKNQWDEFVEKSKNGTFLLKRSYIEYHKEKFKDTSFIIFDEKNKIKGVIAGTILNNTYFTHKGLTYGGFIINKDSKINDVINYFDLLNIELEKLGIKCVEYKSIPYIYTDYPSEEDEYVIFNHLNGKLTNISIASTINLKNEYRFNKSRKSSISKSKRYGLNIDKDIYIKEFWSILNNNLQKNYGVSPVHSLKEILYLKNEFPENIEIYTVRKDNFILGGVVVYLSKNVVHIQYISANEYGKEISALDYLFNYLIKERFTKKEYFDFGTSTENGGRYLNEHLIFQKEGFGARAINYKQYKYEL